MDRTCVYMSTYNGEKYLQDQIESILGQKNVDVTLYVRDDGSKDGTVRIIEDYIRRGSKIILERGENVGFAKSFMLASHHHIEADYYAFSDQDDVWEPDKFYRAITQLKPHDGPMLYGGNLAITDEHLNIKSYWCGDDFPYKCREVQNCSALGYNMYGCTLVWNRKLQDLWEKKMPRYIISQDGYMTALAGAVAGIIVDKEATIFHRLHRNNTAGIENHIIRRIRKGWQHYVGKNRIQRSKVAKQIIEDYPSEMCASGNHNELLYELAYYKKDMKSQLKLAKRICKLPLKWTKKVFLVSLTALGRI